MKRLGLIAIVLFAITSCDSLQKYQLGDKDVLSISGDETKEIFIKKDSDLNGVIAAIEEAKILSDKESFSDLAKLKNYSGKNIVSGKYTLKGSFTNNDLINHLRKGNGREEVNVTFNNCLNIEQLAGKVSAQLQLDSAALVALINSDELIKKYGFNDKTMSTLFIPNTYRFQWSTNEQEFVDRMALEYKKFWNNDRKAKLKAQNLTQSQVAILASIVEEEQNLHPEEWKRIAGVYTNRLDRGILLQADPTVKFALGDRTIKRLLFKHLEVNSPYNTYKHAGVPPGPLRIPSTKSMDAVLDHEEHQFIYFCAKPGGEGYHSFAKTLSQHNANANAYHRWLNKNGY
jgi:UPF0755 protein